MLWPFIDQLTRDRGLVELTLQVMYAVVPTKLIDGLEITVGFDVVTLPGPGI